MDEQSRANRDTKMPLPSRAAANDFDLWRYDGHRGLRFVLDQIASFHAGCEGLGLPYNNPYSFFQALHEQLQPGNRINFCIDGEQADPVEYRPLYIGLLLLYACYGDFLFCSTYTINTAFPSAVKTLLKCKTTGSLQHQLCRYGLEDAFRRMLSGGVREKIFNLYPELIHHENLNHRFNQLRALQHMSNRLPEVSVMPDVFATELFEHFLSFFKARNGIVSESMKYGSLPIVLDQRQRLAGALALRKLADAYDREIDPAAPPVLRDYIENLCVLLDQYPAIITQIKPLSVLQEQRAASEDAISERLGSQKAQAAALLSLLHNKSDDFSPQLWSRMQSCMHTMLHAFSIEPLYAFWEKVYKALVNSPVLEMLAPAYVFRLMSQYQTPIFKAKPLLLKGKKQVDFSSDAFFASFKNSVRSEQRTSAAQAKQDYALFNALQTYFSQNPILIAPERAMNEYVFQRIKETQMAVFSDTSIIPGLRLTHPKSLFRAFALIYDSIEQMGKPLWQSMPHLGKLSVTMQEAESFYLNNKRNAAMSFLLERARNPPVSSKKNLTARQCEEIVQIAFIDDFDKAGKRSPAQCLNDWMENYFKQHSVLQKFAAQSKENREKLMLAVFRLALERHAHMLARNLLTDCADLFYLPIPTEKVAQLWQLFFTERPENFLYKSMNDRIQLSGLPLRSRRLVYLSDPLDRYPKQALVEQSYAAVILACQDPRRCERYINKLKIPTFFHISKTSCVPPQSSERWMEDCITEVNRAQQAGFSGTLLPTINILDLAQRVAAAGFASLDGDAILYLHELYTPCSKLLKHIRNRMGKAWCLAEVQLDTTQGELAQGVFRILAFWLAQDGASAVMVSWQSTEAPYHVMDLANSLSVPILLHSESDAVSPQQILQGSAIFALVEKTE